MKRDVATSANPMKKYGEASNRRALIHRDIGKQMRAETPGTSKKNIVTKPLSLWVTPMKAAKKHPKKIIGDPWDWRRRVHDSLEQADLRSEPRRLSDGY
jgi:hypothetical protein